MTSTLQLNLAEALRLMRERAGFSQSQLAGYLELSRNTVARYEDGATTPKWKDVDSWARICDHDPQIVRDLWETAREFGCLYGSSPDQLALFDGPAARQAARTDRGKFGHTLDAAA